MPSVRLIATCLLAATAAPALADSPPFASAAIADAAGTPLGSARITLDKAGPLLLVDLTGLPPGVHGLHLHAVGACDGTAFAGAGPHLNPAHHQHGTHNPRGSHLGDLPNITATATGEVHASLALAMSTATLRRALLDSDGTALVIHAGPDDYRTDPAGGSGARIACGVFRAP